MCIWDIAVSKRRCEYCSYSGGCEVREKVKTFEEDAKNAVASMENVVPYDLFEPCRHSNIVWARYMVEYYLRSLGYTLYKVASLFNRSHSMVVHSMHEVKKMLDKPGMYPREMAIWQKFQNSLNSQKI